MKIRDSYDPECAGFDGRPFLTHRPPADENRISSAISFADSFKYSFTRNEFHLAAVNLGHPSFGFIRPQFVNIRLRGKVQTGQKPFHQADSIIRGERKSFVIYLVSYRYHAHLFFDFQMIHRQAICGINFLKKL